MVKQAVDLLIYNATVLALDAEERVFDDGAIAVADGRIVGVGATTDLAGRFATNRSWDAKQKIILPGLINTHTHLFQTFMRGLGKDLPLVEWINKSVRRIMPHLDEEAVYLSAMTGCLEAIHSGTTTLVDFMYAQVQPQLSDVVIRAFEDSGIRGVLARGMCDVKEFPGGGRSITWEPIEQCLQDVARLSDKYQKHQLVRIALAPGSVWNMTKEGLRAAAKFGAKHDMLMTMHVLESQIDDEYCIAHHGQRTLPFLADLGVLNSKFLAVHGVRLTGDDIQLLKQHGAKLSHCPTSNMILGSGVAPILQLRAAGVPVGLGTDGAASNDSQNMLEEMKHAALLHKVHNLDAQAMPVKEVVRMATADGAEVLGMQAEIGSLQVGKRADLIVVDYMRADTVPAFEPLATLVYSANALNVDSVVINGEFVLEAGHFPDLDEESLLRAAQRKAHDLII